MKTALKIITIGAFASFAMCLAFHPGSSFAKSQSVQKRCFAYPKAATSQGRLVANETSLQLSWITNCTSPFFATASGSTSLTAYLQRFENGDWRTIDSGLSLSATVGPGTYRVLVVNQVGMPNLYSFTYRKALG